MAPIDIAYLRTWIGRAHADEDTIAPRQVRALSPALLGETITLEAMVEGERATRAATSDRGVRSMEAKAWLSLGHYRINVKMESDALLSRHAV